MSSEVCFADKHRLHIVRSLDDQPYLVAEDESVIYEIFGDKFQRHSVPGMLTMAEHSSLKEVNDMELTR